MNETINFLVEHWGAIAAAASAIGVLVVAVVKKTKTKKDDAVLKHIVDARSYLRNYRDE